MVNYSTKGWKDKITATGDDLHFSTQAIYFARWPMNGIGGGQHAVVSTVLRALPFWTFHVLGVRHTMRMRIPSIPLNFVRHISYALPVNTNCRYYLFKLRNYLEKYWTIVHSKMNPGIQYVPKFHVCSVCSCPLAKLQGPTKYVSLRAMVTTISLFCILYWYRMKMYRSIGVLTGSFLTRKKEIILAVLKFNYTLELSHILLYLLLST